MYTLSWGGWWLVAAVTAACVPVSLSASPLRTSESLRLSLADLQVPVFRPGAPVGHWPMTFTRGGLPPLDPILIIINDLYQGAYPALGPHTSR